MSIKNQQYHFNIEWIQFASSDIQIHIHVFCSCVYIICCCCMLYFECMCASFCIYIFFFHCNHRRQFLWSSVVVNGEWSIRNSFLLSLSWVLIPYISLSIILFFSLWKSVKIYPFSIENVVKCCNLRYKENENWFIIFLFLNRLKE